MRSLLLSLYFFSAFSLFVANNCALTSAVGTGRLVRFVKTVTFFNRVKLPFITKSTGVGMTTEIVAPGTKLYSADEKTQQAGGLSWGPLDDIVMGGVSKTALEPGKFEGVFKGMVSTDNNGGFAGIRTKFEAPKDISSCKSFKLRVLGDGKRYKFIARDSEAWNGIAWSFSFDTSDQQWVDVTIPIKDLKPTKFARIVADSPPFNKKRLQGLQITLSKFEYEGKLNPNFAPGLFALNIDSIGVE